MAWTRRKERIMNRLSTVYIIVFIAFAFLCVAGKIPNDTYKILLAVAFWAEAYIFYQGGVRPKASETARRILPAVIILVPSLLALPLSKRGGAFADLCQWAIVCAIIMFVVITVLLSLYKKRKFMRKKIVAGNWKMNTTPAQGAQLASEVVLKSAEVASDVDFIVCPPFTHLSQVQEIAKGTRVSVGAQNCAAEPKGAFTGEVSAEMIASMGIGYTILGHSERRQYYGETSQTLNAKMAQAFANNLIPIYCVGENLDEREAGNHFDVVRKQLEEVVFNLTESQFEKLIIAYEPVWAIGTGRTATADQAEEIHAFIRKTLSQKFGTAAASTPILYGGSCKPSNAAEIFAKENVDGGLIGGAALKADDFIAIGKAFK